MLHTALLDLLLPTPCAGCPAPGPLCPSCAEALRGPAFLAWPTPSPPGLPPPFAVAAYAGPVRAALLAHKERGRLGLGAPLGAALAVAVHAAVHAAVQRLDTAAPVARGGSPPIALVPVPSAAAVVRGRGHDPTRRLARRAARHLPQARVVPALRSARRVADSAGLSVAARAANLAGAFAPASRAVRDQAAGRVVVLVDDVVTTGATLAQAAAVLQSAGVAVAGCATVAATRRRFPARPGPGQGDLGCARGEARVSVAR